MRLPRWARKALLKGIQKITILRRPADIIIGPMDNVYLFRWHVIPRNVFFNIYFHIFRRSDDDRALHDHPWWNISILLDGNYQEVVPLRRDEPLGTTRVMFREEGQIVARRAEAAHRVLLYRFGNDELPVKTLFITGPKLRQWGFWCAQGWKHWKQFTKPGPHGKSSEVGEGCGEYDGKAPLSDGYPSYLWTGRR